MSWESERCDKHAIDLPEPPDGHRPKAPLNHQSGHKSSHVRYNSYNRVYKAVHGQKRGSAGKRGWWTKGNERKIRKSKKLLLFFRHQAYQFHCRVELQEKRRQTESQLESGFGFYSRHQQSTSCYQGQRHCGKLKEALNSLWMQLQLHFDSMRMGMGMRMRITLWTRKRTCLALCLFPVDLRAKLTR